MRLCVLNGSPKGRMSVTMQYVRYLEIAFPSVEFEILDIAAHIARIERNADKFFQVIDSVGRADAVLFAFPVYFFLVPSQYKRFIELVFEKNATDAFSGKPSASLSTSVHIVDHTAHNYISGIAQDFGTRFFGAYSADMEDLLKKAERKNLEAFFGAFVKAVQNSEPSPTLHLPLKAAKRVYKPGAVKQKVGLAQKKLLLLADRREEDSNLDKMITRFASCIEGDIEIAYIEEIGVKTGCSGCIGCHYDNRCRFDSSDGFRAFYENKVKKADILVYCGAMHDRYLSSLWKRFIDRSFYNGHVPTLMGKQVGWIISGPLSLEQNLVQLLNAYTRLMDANPVMLVSDEYKSSEIDALLETLASRLVVFAESSFVSPPDFIPTGVMNTFRNEIAGRLNFVFRADHRTYKKRGYYKIPQKGLRSRLLSLSIGPMLLVPAFRKQFSKRIPREMVRPYEPVLALEKFKRR
ncbi:MAG: NAD(P)H-dependent oxidoreductase [Desulfatibacillaceae bacterium]|nr:NAD(P)H-dependent oxidoreductase [Desulfatibacillaceae bacterium]